MSPDLTEQLIGVMLCREYPRALRVRPSQGDGGIDVMVPIEDGRTDIYQVKYFPTSLNNSRKGQIRKSLRRITENTSVAVRNWYLTLPLNPSNSERSWFDTATRGAPFKCDWFGLDRVESLAAAYPDVVDYYVRNGRDQLDRSIADLRSLAGLMRPAAGQFLEPADLAEPLTALYGLLNRDDPHYRYEFEVGRLRPMEELAERPDLVASVSAGTGDVAVTHHVYARYDMATQDAPIAISFQVNEEDLDTTSGEAWQRALRFGTPVELTARNVTAGLPGGLGDTVELAQMQIGPALNPTVGPYKIRLGVLDPAGLLLADAVIDMQPVTQGLAGGTRAHGTELGGSFEFEVLIAPPDEPSPSLSMRFSPLSPAGKAPAALERGTRFLAEIHQPNRLVVGPEYGPLLGNPTDLPQAEAPISPAFAELIDALAVLQNDILASLVVPDLEALDPESRWQILRAAALVRGETVRDTWSDQVIEFHDTTEIPASPAQLAIQGNYPITVGDQLVDIDPVVIVWLAADYEVERLDDGRVRLTASPTFGNNIRHMKRDHIENVPPTPIPVD